MEPLDLALYVGEEGEQVTIRRGAESASVKAKVLQGVPIETASGRLIVTNRLVIGAADSGWSTFPVPPRAEDLIEFGGRERIISGVKVSKLGDRAALYVLATAG